jgi:hypothetical protein
MEPQTEQRMPPPGWKLKLPAFVLTALVLTVILAIVLLPDAGSWAYLEWARRHPAQRARVDPHHWLNKIALLMLLVTFGSALWTGLRDFFRRAQAALVIVGHWRRVFLPLPWERRREPQRTKEK